MPLASKNYNNDNSNSFSIECGSRESLARKLDSQNKIKKLSKTLPSSTSSIASTKSIKAKTSQNKTIRMTPAALSLAQRISASKMITKKSHAFD